MPEDKIMGQVASVAIQSSTDRPVAAIDRFMPQRDLWVQLRNPPTQYAEDVALLVCAADVDVWVAWVPGYGEILLNRSAFHRMGEAV
jgi:hypothetical protein